MENIQAKADFLRNKYTHLLASLDAGTPRLWGKMNAQQMIEHMSDYVHMACDCTLPIATEEAMLPRMHTFLESEKPFRENTPNVLMPDTPPPVRHTDIATAIEELQQEINRFFAAHEADSDKVTVNPFFGHLDFEHQVQLLYKHATHHLRQFGITEAI